MASKQTRTPTARHYLWLGHALLVLTAYGSLIPLRYHPVPLDEALARFQAIPLFDPALTFARGDWVVNAVQYALLTYCYVGACGVDRRSLAGDLGMAALLPAIGMVAVMLEFLQIYFPFRTVSLNDLIVEWTGVATGALAWALVGQALTDWLRRFWDRRGVAGLATQFLPLYVALLLVVHLMPFDAVLGREELSRKFAEGRIMLVPFAGLAAGGAPALARLVLNVAAFAVAGALAGLTPWGARLGRPAVMGLGLAAAALVEGLQLVVFTRYCDVTDVVTGTAGAYLGWRLARAGADAVRTGRWGDGRWRVRPAGIGALIIAWVVVLVLVNWQPYHFTTDLAAFTGADPSMTDENSAIFGLRRMAWAPLVDYYWGSRYDALDQFVRRSLSFTPLGVLAALVAGRRGRAGAVSTVLGALALGVVIEVGQYFIPERHPGTTDVLLETLGAGLGYALARHVAHALEPDREARGHARHARVTSAGGPAAVQPRGDLRARRAGGFPNALRRPPPGVRVVLPAAPPWAGRVNALIAWFNAQPYNIQLLSVCVTVFVLVSGGVVLGRALGWLE